MNTKFVALVICVIYDIYIYDDEVCSVIPDVLSIIGPIVAISRLSFASVYSTICTKSVVIAYKKNGYKQPLYFGICDYCTISIACSGTRHGQKIQTSLKFIIN